MEASATKVCRTCDIFYSFEQKQCSQCNQDLSKYFCETCKLHVSNIWKHFNSDRHIQLTVLEDKEKGEPSISSNKRNIELLEEIKKFARYLTFSFFLTKISSKTIQAE